MPPPTANEIKSQLATLLLPVIGTAATKKTKIIDTMQYPFGRGADPTALRSELDEVVLFEGEGVKSRINCLMITEAGFGQSSPSDDNTLMQRQARGKKIITRRFRLTFFYEVGELSENEASSIIEAARVALNDSPKLGFATVTTIDDNYHDGPAMFIEGHDGLQMQSFLPESFGTPMAHVGDCLLSVRVTEPQQRS